MADVFEPEAGMANLEDYEATVRSFDWESVHSRFRWSETGRVNLAYEAIDRHVDDGRGDDVALYYEDTDRRETYTYSQISLLTNRFANVLRSMGIQKGDRVFLLMPRSPELVIALFGILKVGAVAGPLFEAFMTDAVRDRMLDSQAVAVAIRL